jgi:hypothetical protein
MGSLDDGPVARRRSGDLNEHTPQVSHWMDDTRAVVPSAEFFVYRGNGSDKIPGDLDA